MKRVLIVCKGNTCRSPMAVALLADLLRRRGHASLVQVRSAGIWATEGQPATADAQKAMCERGLDVSGHKAHLLNLEDIRQADLLITMERSIDEAIRIEAPESIGKVYTLGDLADDPRDVEDPVGGTLADYRHTVEILQGMLQRAYGRIMSILELPSCTSCQPG
ncbi:MAG: arsenate reductase/protein-tyrosine-phosphatase family protein [Anaerolineae bacterium]